MQNKGGLVRLRLSKSERLSSVKHIDFLFKHCKRIKRFPLALNYVFTEHAPEPIQAMFAAPKRQFKKAVDRNRVKRVMRDRYRLLKPDFIATIGQKQMHCALIYIGKTLPDYKAIDKSLQLILKDLKSSCASEKPLA